MGLENGANYSWCRHPQGIIYVPTGTAIDREANGNLINSAGQAVITFDIQVSDGKLTDTAEV